MGLLKGIKTNSDPSFMVLDFFCPDADPEIKNLSAFHQPKRLTAHGL